jgi:PAS domain S-box-containing protein
MRRAAAKKQETLGDIDAKTASSLIGSSSDIALLLDRAGTVLDVIVHDSSLAALAGPGWKGRPWVDTVTVESRDKIEALLRDAGSSGRWRQVNHPVRGSEDLPVSYSCAVLRPDAPAGKPALVAFGRDLRATVQLQRRLIDAQQAMERDYWRFREAETRYRTLFQTAPEAVLIVDGQALKLLEANPAAERLLGRAAARLQGAAFAGLFDEGSQERLQTLVAAARTVGAREPLRLRLAAPAAGDVEVAVTLFRQDQAAYLLVRLAALAAAEPAARGARAKGAKGARGSVGAATLGNGADAAPALFDRYVREAPDALVFTDTQGRVQRANAAFAALAQLSSEDQARGELLDRWLGRTGVELSVLLTNLRQHGSVGLFTTSLRGEVGAVHEVEIAATELGSGAQAALAFCVRDIGRRLVGEDRTQAKIARSASELTELVGRVPMKDIVAETSDLIEQLCIETALQMTHDNRALAAQFLGLSRQSLYVKLRRYGLGDLGNDGAD